MVITFLMQGPLIRDVLNMARFHVPNTINSLSKEHLAKHIETYFKERVCEKSADSDEGSQYCNDTSRYSFDLTETEKKKQEFYENVPQVITVPNGNTWMVEEKCVSSQEDARTKTNILDDLTSDDIRRLIETEDELSQSHG